MLTADRCIFALKGLLPGASSLPDQLPRIRWHRLERANIHAANVTGLQWTQVDLVRRSAWIHPDQAKARKAIAVPLNGEAVDIIPSRIGNHATHVFSFRGEPIRQVSTKAWYQALQRAGIENFRWHDLRHTRASWHMQNGTPLSALQELGGWESPEMVRRYAHFSAEHLAPYADRLCALRAVDLEVLGTI
jgi:integrase